MSVMMMEEINTQDFLSSAAARKYISQICANAVKQVQQGGFCLLPPA